ncbi:hypothetical protein N9A27_07770, partial [Porticoccaceae bacterium]|nr:hypothetical protein [Porticoccaceae bacterium]
QSNLERLFQDSNYQQDIVLGKVFKKMGIDDYEQEVKEAINHWVSAWPSDSELLAKNIISIAEKTIND